MSTTVSDEFNDHFKKALYQYLEFEPADASINEFVGILREFSDRTISVAIASAVKSWIETYVDADEYELTPVITDLATSVKSRLS